MNKKSPKSVKMFVRCMVAVALSTIVLLGTSTGVSADEADAKRILKAMSDYMGAQKSLSFEFDATLEVVTKDEQKLALASSGREPPASRTAVTTSPICSTSISISRNRIPRKGLVCSYSSASRTEIPIDCTGWLSGAWAAKV